MALTIDQIRNVNSDEALLDLLLTELRCLFPPERREDPIVFLSFLQAAPQGLRAMATTYDLDVSMALDDLAWHFVNHHSSQDFAEETILGLRELGAAEAAEIFAAAFAIIQPFWVELENVPSEEAHAWLDSTGIQGRIDPLTQRLWDLLKQQPSNSLMDYWGAYARKNPQHCLAAS